MIEKRFFESLFINIHLTVRRKNSFPRALHVHIWTRLMGRLTGKTRFIKMLFADAFGNITCRFALQKHESVIWIKFSISSKNFSFRFGYSAQERVECSLICSHYIADGLNRSSIITVSIDNYLGEPCARRTSTKAKARKRRSGHSCWRFQCRWWVLSLDGENLQYDRNSCCIKGEAKLLVNE